MKKIFSIKNTGFTLLELLIVIGILAILATTVTIILNPAELLRQARDSQRLSDLKSLDQAISFYAITATTPLFTGTSTQGQGTCTAIGAIPNPFTGACSASTSTKVDGTGWMTINFAGTPTGASLSKLPLDPVNDSTYFYAFRAIKNVWEINGTLESDKYKNQQQVMKNDGGDNDSFYEIGSSLTLGCPSSTQDIEGNTYNTVIINNQCWMKENMRTTKYPNGTPIDGTYKSSGTTVWGTDNAYYSCPPNISNSGPDCAAALPPTNLGYLYQWSAAMNGATTEGTQGICPAGWHISTKNEQYALENYLKDSGQTCLETRSNAFDCATAGDKLKNVANCSTPGPNCGSSAFEGLLAGQRDSNGAFVSRGAIAVFWSSNTYSSSNSWFRMLSLSASTVYLSTYTKARGFSVRCLND